MKKILQEIRSGLNSFANVEDARQLQRFFKTGPGEYGEGDRFLGVRVPNTRKIAKKFSHLTLGEIQLLIKSIYHEERLTALLILVIQFERAKDEAVRKKIFNFYVKNFRYVNNWDLVDLTAHKIAGKFLLNRDKRVLKIWAKSPDLWTRRISVISTFAFINENKFTHSIRIAEILLKDDHDLIHKAVGWMLREIGKRDQQLEEVFLKKHCRKMPRTMLRYAIEKFPEKLRQSYLKA